MKHALAQFFHSCGYTHSNLLRTGRSTLRGAALVAGALLLLSRPAVAQTKYRLFDQVTAKGIGLTPAKGQLFYTSDTSGTITPLAAGSTGWCLVVSGAGIPSWSNVCTGVVSSVGLSAPVQFSVSGSPVTSSGTLSLGWASQPINTFLAGPPSGGSAAPSFRSLVAADLGLTTKGDLLVRDSSILGRLPVGTDNYVLTADSTTSFGVKWAAIGAGTVTSVGLTMPSEFSVGGSPVTTSGTLAASWASATQHRVFAAPSGSSGTPSFRALVPSDIGITTKGDLLTRDSTDAFTRIAHGTDGQVLSSDTASTGGLKWIDVAGTGTVTSVALSLPSEITVSGSPVTTSGTLTGAWANQTQRKFLASPTGSTGAPSFRALSPYDLGLTTKGDIVLVDTGPTFVRLPVGTDGFALVADSASSGGVKWSSAGAGTVVSVGLTVPSWYSVAGSPVTSSGTLAISAATGQIQHGFLAAPSGSTGALSVRTIVGSDLPLNTISAPGAVTTAPNDVTKFYRGDASWATPAFVTSVALTAPSEITVSGSPVTSSGTLGLGWATETANRVFAGPTTGAADVPTFRALVAADLPVFVASGAGHKAGAVPDPGAAAGTTKYLNEDGTWKVPTFSSSIEVKESDGAPDVTGVSILAFDQATGFTVTDNGSGQVTVACTSCGGGGGTTAARQDTFDGDGSTTVFTLAAAPATNGIMYVALNGLPQIGTAWSASGSNVTMTAAPISGAKLVVGYFTALPGSVTHTQEDFTGAGATDFTLAHTPATNGVLVVALRGLIQPQTSWSLVGGTTLRFASSVPSGDAVSISYNY